MARDWKAKERYCGLSGTGGWKVLVVIVLMVVLVVPMALVVLIASNS